MIGKNVKENDMKTVLMVCLLLILIGCDESPEYEVRMKYNLRGDTTYYLVVDMPGSQLVEKVGYESNNYDKVDSVGKAKKFKWLVKDSSRFRHSIWK